MQIKSEMGTVIRSDSPTAPPAVLPTTPKAKTQDDSYTANIFLTVTDFWTFPCCIGV